MSRVAVHQDIMKIHELQGRVLKVCSDSIYFTLPKLPNPLKYSESIGFWKPVFPGPLLALSQMGVHSYAALFQQGDEIVTVAKASGLTMSQALTSGLDYNVYSEMVNQLINDKLFDVKKCRVDNIRRQQDKKTLSYTKVRKRRTVFSRNLFYKRKLDRSLKNYSKFALHPYGFLTD
jgi:hypothetical protein